MIYKCVYKTPKGFSNIIMSSNGEILTGLYFENDKNISKYHYEEKDLEIFKETSKWLDIYFSGKDPDFMPEIRIENLTPFRKDVLEIVQSISFGQTLTYKDMAQMIAKNRGIPKMSSQAVGGAVGWNPICIIIPCHRVVGTNGNLTGYNGGIENKIALLKHEKNDMDEYFLP